MMTRPVLTIVGAGMSGLLTAYWAVQKGWAVEIFESDEVGGKIQSRSTPLGLVETAANAILADALVEEVAAALGLVLLEKKSSAKKRFIFRDGAPRRWPLGFVASALTLGFFARRPLGLAPQPRAHESLQSWGERAFGKEATDFLLTPACLGIFGLGAEQLSAHLVFEYFFGGPRRVHGKLRGSVAPQNGMGEFPRSLKSYLIQKGVTFHHRSWTPQEPRPPGPLVLATDAPSAQVLLETMKDPRAEAYKSLNYVDLTTVTQFYSQPPVAQYEGFGILFPRREPIIPLGVLLNSSIFSSRAQAPTTSETWILRGSATPVDAEALIQDARQKLWNDSSVPLQSTVTPWPRALVAYDQHLERFISEVPIEHRGVYLMGNYLGELGLNRLFHRSRALTELLSGHFK